MNLLKKYDDFCQKLIDMIIDPLADFIVRRRDNDPEQQRLSEEVWAHEEYVAGLTIEEAKAKLYEAIVGGKLHVVEEEPVDDARLNVLAPEVRELLRRYRTLACMSWLRREEFAEGKDDMAGFLIIGHGTDFVRACVKPHEEPVYLYDGDPDDMSDSDYASVYHWLLASIDMDDIPSK